MLMQFQKGDIVRHLGLLDLQRTMQRALRRSGLPIAYSNGFNPHIVMSFASALREFQAMLSFWTFLCTAKRQRKRAWKR